MKNVIQWLKDNFGEDIQIATPQFERTKKLEFDYIPRTEDEFLAVVQTAPVDILIGLGFGKWSTVNECRAENAKRPVCDKVSIPFINAPGDFVVDCGRGDNPTELLEVNEDILLIPYEWYNIIPDGFIVTGLYGEQYPFQKGKTDDDYRFGCLAYGITRPVSKPENK